MGSNYRGINVWHGKCYETEKDDADAKLQEDLTACSSSQSKVLFVLVKYAVNVKGCKGGHKVSDGSKHALESKLFGAHVRLGSQKTEDLCVQQRKGGREEKVEESEADKDVDISKKDLIFVAKDGHAESNGNDGEENSRQNQQRLVAACAICQGGPEHGSKKVGHNNRRSECILIVGEIPLLEEEHGHDTMKDVSKHVDEKVQHLWHDHPFCSK